MLQISDLPLLVFGGKDDKHTIAMVEYHVDRESSVDSNIACGEKCGTIPLAWSMLLSDQMRHQVVLEEDSITDVDKKPHALLLSNMELEIKIYWSILVSKGFDGELLRLDDPRVMNNNSVDVAWR